MNRGYAGGAIVRSTFDGNGPDAIGGHEPHGLDGDGPLVCWLRGRSRIWSQCGGA